MTARAIRCLRIISASTYNFMQKYPRFRQEKNMRRKIRRLQVLTVLVSVEECIPLSDSGVTREQLD